MFERARVHTRPPAALSAAGSMAVSRGVIGAVVFAGLTFIGANIYIPLTPVPVTLQTLFVLLAGAAIGGRYGSLSQAFYVAAGVLGLPVFAGSLAGWAVLAGPTGGYLISFLIVPFVVGALVRRSRTIPWLLLSYSAGTIVVFTLGVAHLTFYCPGGVGEAMRVGLLPFLPGAVIKIAAATSISRSYWGLAERRRIRRGN